MQLDLLSNFDFSTLSKAPKIYSLCKWGALIIAILAVLSGIIARTKFIFLKISRIKIFASTTIDSIKLLNSDDFDDLDDDDDDDFDNMGNDTCSSLSLSSDEERESEDEREESFGRCFSWSDFATGNSVIRLWDNIASGFDFEEERNNDIVLVWSDKAKNNGVRKVSTESKAEGLSLRRRAVKGADSGGVNSFCNCSNYAKCNCRFSSNHVQF